MPRLSTAAAIATMILRFTALLLFRAAPAAALSQRNTSLSLRFARQQNEDFDKRRNYATAQGGGAWLDLNDVEMQPPSVRSAEVPKRGDLDGSGTASLSVNPRTAKCVGRSRWLCSHPHTGSDSCAGSSAADSRPSPIGLVRATSVSGAFKVNELLAGRDGTDAHELPSDKGPKGTGWHCPYSGYG